MTTDVLILCGGYNRRLRAVLPEGTPKALADVNGQPFLRILGDYVRSQLPRSRVTLCTGYGYDYICQFLNNTELGFRVSYEGLPKGTCHAILRAGPLIESNSFLVLNGDTYCEVDYEHVMEQHRGYGALLTKVIDTQGVPVGAFVLDRSLLFLNPRPPEGANLEDMIAKAEAARTVQVCHYMTDQPWYDIGTPAGLERFRKYQIAK